MKTILLIPVGGTICTAAEADGTRALVDGADIKLCDTFLHSDSPMASSVRFKTAPSLRLLSENMTIDGWNAMLDTFRTYADDPALDGVIVAHGTDTLAFSAAMFAMILSGYDRPVCFVAANAPLDDPRSNGHDNFQAAVEAICRGLAPQVYVPYRNVSDGAMRWHLGARLRQCPVYSEDFESLGEDILPTARKPLCDWRGTWHLSDRVKLMHPYVGQRYDDVSLDGYASVLHTTYHSGTVASEGGVYALTTLLARCEAQGIDVWLAPAKATGDVYETVRSLVQGAHPLRFLYGCTVEAAYAKLTLCRSLGFSNEETAAWMQEDVAAEFAVATASEACYTE